MTHDELDDGPPYFAKYYTTSPRRTATDLDNDDVDLCPCLMEPTPAQDVMIAMHRFNCPDWQAYGA